MIKVFFAHAISGPFKGRQFLINPESKTLIGRSNEADIRLGNDPFCSRRHATLFWVGDRCFIEDANSTNGTFINQKKITMRTELHNKDTVQIGGTELVFLTKDLLDGKQPPEVISPLKKG